MWYFFNDSLFQPWIFEKKFCFPPWFLDDWEHANLLNSLCWCYSFGLFHGDTQSWSLWPVMIASMLADNFGPAMGPVKSDIGGNISVRWSLLYAAAVNAFSVSIAIFCRRNWSISHSLLFFFLLQRLETRYLSNQSEFNYLYRIVQSEIESKKAKSSSSCTNALLWLTRLALTPYFIWKNYRFVSVRSVQFLMFHVWDSICLTSIGPWISCQNCSAT